MNVAIPLIAMLVCAPACDQETTAGGGPPDGALVDGGLDGSISDGTESSADATRNDLAAPPIQYVYVGGYSPLIAIFTLDPASGALLPSGSVAVGGSPSFLATDAQHAHLYAADEASGGGVSSFAIDAKTGALRHVNDAAMAGGPPVHVSVDDTGKWLLAASYASGNVATFPIASDGSLGAATQTQNAGAWAHQVITAGANRYALVPCKGSDYVAQYLFSDQTGQLTPNAVPQLATGPAGSAAWGPRHLAFHPDHPFAYLIMETNSTIAAYSFDALNGRLNAIQPPLSTLTTPVVGNTGAEVAVHPSGQFVYASNRGDDSIAWFAVDGAGQLSLRGTQKTGGRTPRHFSIEPSGRWLLVAEQGTDHIGVFAIDPVTGALTMAGTGASYVQPAFVGVVAQPGG